MFKMGCSMARKILPGSSSSGGGGDGAGQQAACFSLGGQPGKSSGGRGANENNNNNSAAATAATQQSQDQPKRVANSSELNDFSKLEDDPRIPLNVRQIFKITKSWKAIARTMSKTGTAMFLNLFEQNQDLFHLFDRFQHLKGKELHDSMELREHAATVMSTLDTSINSLSDYDNFVTYLHSIGELHRKVPGFKREYFWKIEQPFMKAVKQTLDERCNETIEEIYKIAIKLIIETIADGYGTQDGGQGVVDGPVMPNERRDDASGPKNGGGGGGGGAQSGGNNNNKSGGGKSGSAMAPQEPGGAAGGQQQKQRPHKVTQTKTTTARTELARGFTRSISEKELNPFACPVPAHSTRHKDNNGHDGPFIISESQSHERRDEEKGDNKNNNNNNNNNNKYLRASRLCCTVRRNQILVKTKRALHHMQSLIISTLAKATRHTANLNCSSHNQNIETSHRPQDQDRDHNEQEDYLDDLVMSTCKLLKTTSKLIEERLQSHNEKQDTKTGEHDGGDSRGEDDKLAKLIKWRGLLGELTGGSGNQLLSTSVTGDVQNSCSQARDTTTTTTTTMVLLPVQTHPSQCNGERFNIKSGTGSSVRVVVPTGANDYGNPLELRRGPEQQSPIVSEPDPQNYNLPLPLLGTEPASDLLAVANCVTGESEVRINASGGQTTANGESVPQARETSGQSTRSARSFCPRNATPRDVELSARLVAESTAATATCTNIIRLASVGDEEALPAVSQPAAVESAVPCEQPAADATNTQIDEMNNGGSANLIDFIKLLLMINNLILASTSLTERTSSSIPQSNPTLTTVCPQVRV